MIKHFENVGRCFPWKNEERCLDPGPERWRARSPQSRNPMRNVIGGDHRQNVGLRSEIVCGSSGVLGVKLKET